MTTTTSTNDHDRAKCIFHEWINTQRNELGLIEDALKKRANGEINDEKLKQLNDTTVNSFQTYVEKRKNQARRDVSPFYAPAWCSTLENSQLWIGGCRPSIKIRLIYALCGSKIESQLREFLQGLSTKFLDDLSAEQMSRINTLHSKTITGENRLSSKIASLQEEVADQPIAIIAKELASVNEINGEIDKALDRHEHAMGAILEEADNLRLETLKDLMDILTPLQAADFLAVGKRLHLGFHHWGISRDRKHGRNVEGS
ncbi:hypothetical protein ACFE04_020436 [Oxalis oulophora]